MHSYDVEAGNGLGELAEDSDEDSGSTGRKRTSFEDANGRRKQGESAFGPPRRAGTVESERVGAGQKSFDRVRR